MDTGGFYRNLEEKQSKILACLDQYFQTAVSIQNQGKKDEALLALSDVARVLAEQMAAEDTPVWLSKLARIGELRRGNPNNDKVWQRCFHEIKQLEPMIRRHTWTQQGNEADPIIDFDAIVSKHRNKEEVERLFDKLVQALEKLIACEELDSRRVIVDLERLLTTLRKSRSGSFQFQLLSAEVAKRYLKRLMVSWLRTTKLAKVLIEAANDTVDELGMTMEEAKTKIQEEVSSIELGMFERLSESTRHQLGHESTSSDDNGESRGDWFDLKSDSELQIGTRPRLPHKDDSENAP